jgi:hypothetical protein
VGGLMTGSLEGDGMEAQLIGMLHRDKPGRIDHSVRDL